ncbi:hypothetical protein C8R44DRAFT_725067 [Mycena epipterygia]|nr:hypothetical protein C8R44DRAFT_725067 [Mycena epipterygia]
MSLPPRVEHLTFYGARFIQLRAGFGRAFLSLLDPCITEIHFLDIECCWFEDNAIHKHSHLIHDIIYEYTRLFPALRDSCIRGGLSVEHVPPLRNYTHLIPVKASHHPIMHPEDLAHALQRLRRTPPISSLAMALSIAQVRTWTASQSVFNFHRCIVDPRLSTTAKSAALVTATSFKISLLDKLASDYFKTPKALERAVIFWELDPHVAGILSDPRQLNTHPPNHQRPSGFAAAFEDECSLTYYHRKIALKLIEKLDQGLIKRSLESGEQNEPMKSWVDQELVKNGAEWPLGIKELTFSPYRPPSTAPQLSINPSLSSKN